MFRGRYAGGGAEVELCPLAALFDPNAAKGKGRVNIPVNAVSQSFVMISEWFHSIPFRARYPV